MSNATLKASMDLLYRAPELLEDDQEYSFTYSGSPPRLVMVAVGDTAQALHGLALSLAKVTEAAA